MGNNGYVNFLGVNKVHYGLGENGNLPKPALTCTLFECLRNVTQLHFLYRLVQIWDLVKIIAVYLKNILRARPCQGNMSWASTQFKWLPTVEGSRMILIISWSEIDPPCWCAFTGAVLLYTFKMLYSKVNCILNVIVFNRMIKMLFLFIYLIDCFLYTSDIHEFVLFYLRNVRKCLTLRSMTALWSHGKLDRVPIILIKLFYVE